MTAPVSFTIGTPLPLISPPATEAAPSAGPRFSGVLDQMLGKAASQQARSDEAVRDLALGHTDNLHGAVLEVAKTDLVFRLLLEVRNRLTDAYQEIMKMQV